MSADTMRLPSRTVHSQTLRGYIVAALMAVLPLFPGGLRYVGRGDVDVIDAVVLAILVTAGLLAVSRRWFGSGTNREAAEESRPLLWVYVGFMAAMTGAMLVGLASENRIGSPVWTAYSREMLTHILTPIEFTTDPFYPARTWLNVVEGFLVFVAVRRMCLDAPDPAACARSASRGWVAGLTFVSVFAIVQYVTRFNLHPLWVARNPGLVRANATLDDPNMLGSYLLLGTGFAVGLALGDSEPRWRRVCAAATALGCVAILTTVSRTALVALCLMTLLLCAVFPSGLTAWSATRLMAVRRGARIALGVSAALAVLLLGLRLVVAPRAPEPPTNVAQALVQTIDPRVPLSNVLKERLTYWDAALRMASARPITGQGLGMYPRRATDYRRRWVPLENAHNMALQILAETGGLGVGWFAAIMALSLTMIGRAVQFGSGHRVSFGIGSLFGIGGFAVTLLTGNALVVSSGQLLWGAALAVAVAGVSGAGTGPRRTSPQRFGQALATALAFTVGAYGVAIARTVPAPRADSPWGYAWGLFPVESGFFPLSWGLQPDPEGTALPPVGTGSARFRWTGPRAEIELQTRPTDVACVLTVTTPLPTITRGPQLMRVHAGGTVMNVVLPDSELRTVRIPLVERARDMDGRLAIRIEVMPSFIPASVGRSGDRRRLGVQLFQPVCQGAAPDSGG